MPYTSQLTRYTNQSAYKNFISSVDSSATRKSYRYAVYYFIKYCNLQSYDDLLVISSDRLKLEGMIRDYIVHLKEEKKSSPASIRLYLAALAHFYGINDITINWKKLNKFKGKFRNVIEDKPYTHDQIKKLVDIAPLRDKCTILLMASTGMRKGALGYLRLRDIQKINKYQLYRISVYKKEQENYVTFCTPECAIYIDQYLDWRIRLGEKLTPNSPLLRIVFDTVTEINVPRPIGPHIVGSQIRKLLDDTGIRAATNELGRHSELMECHGFRKFFKTACINAGMNPLYSEYVMGHRSGLTKSYFKPSDMELLEGNDKALGYVAAINDLTINEEHRLTTKVTELQLKNDQIMELERQHRKDLEAVQNQMAQIMEMIRHNPRLAHVKPESLIKKSIS